MTDLVWNIAALAALGWSIWMWVGLRRDERRFRESERKSLELIANHIRRQERPELRLIKGGKRHG